MSEPATVENGVLVEGRIARDEAWSTRTNTWLVQGFNDGNADVIVRPWVACAKVGG